MGGRFPPSLNALKCTSTVQHSSEGECEEWTAKGKQRLDHYGIGTRIDHETRLDLMEAGTELNHNDLREKAHGLAKDGPTYAELAESLDVSENAVAKAVTTTGPKFQRLQMRIVELLSDYEVEQRQGFILHPKDK